MRESTGVTERPTPPPPPDFVCGPLKLNSVYAKIVLADSNGPVLFQKNRPSLTFSRLNCAREGRNIDGIITW